MVGQMYSQTWGVAFGVQCPVHEVGTLWTSVVVSSVFPVIEYQWKHSVPPGDAAEHSRKTWVRASSVWEDGTWRITAGMAGRLPPFWWCTTHGSLASRLLLCGLCTALGSLASRLLLYGLCTVMRLTNRCQEVFVACAVHVLL